MTKGHDKGHKGQMSDRDVMKLACGCEDCKPSFDESEIGDGFYYAQKLPEKP